MMKTNTGFMLNDAQSGIICHQVNCQGVMGSGIALAIRNKWPIVFEEYKKYVDKKLEFDGWSGGAPDADSLLGDFLPVQVDDNLWVGNLFSQCSYGRNPAAQRFGRYTSYDALDICFRNVATWATVMEGDEVVLREVHYPQIGCGLGGGDWSIVSKIIDVRLDTIPHTYWEYKKTA